MRYALIVGSLVMMAGCSARTSAPPAQADVNGSRTVRSIDGSIEGEIEGTPQSGGKFAKLRIGMPMKQVTDLIGQPNDADAHITGKSFIPFYFGGDSMRTEAYYKGEGRLTYSAEHFAGAPNRLIGIHVNRGDSGYAR